MRRAEGFYDKQTWKKCRASYVKHRQGIDGGQCEVCRENIGVIVHHKVHMDYITMQDANLAYGFNNLQLVCHHCHDVMHGFAGKEQKARRITFDEFGNVIPIIPL